MTVNKLAFLNPAIWLSVIIFTSLIPFAIFAIYDNGHSLKTDKFFHYFVLFSFSITLIVGYILSFLSLKYTENNISSVSSYSHLPILLIISTIVAIVAIIFTSPNELKSILYVFSFSYVIIFVSWLYISHVQYKIQTAPDFDIDIILMELTSEKVFLVKLLLLMKLLQPDYINPKLNDLLKEVKEERRLAERFRLVSKFFQSNYINPKLNDLLKEVKEERRLAERFRLVSKFFLSIFNETFEDLEIPKPMEKDSHSHLNIASYLSRLRFFSIPFTNPIWILLKFFSIPFTNPIWILLKYSFKYIAITKIKTKKSVDNVSSFNSSVNSSNNFAKLFYLIFAIISGLAITKALEKFSQALKSNVSSVTEVMSSNQTIPTNMTNSIPWGIQISSSSVVDVIVLVCFFTVSIPFIHATAVLLTNTNLIDRPTQKQKSIVIHYILMLIETIFLFLIAEHVNINENGSLFLVFLTLMVVVDVLWTIAEFSIIKNNNLPLQWLYNNFITVLLLFYFFVYLSSPMFGTKSLMDYPIIYFILMIALMSRCIINYKVGWEGIYSKGIGHSNL